MLVWRQPRRTIQTTASLSRPKARQAKSLQILTYEDAHICIQRYIRQWVSTTPKVGWYTQGWGIHEKPHVWRMWHIPPPKGLPNTLTKGRKDATWKSQKGPNNCRWAKKGVSNDVNAGTSKAIIRIIAKFTSKEINPTSKHHESLEVTSDGAASWQCKDGSS